MDITHRQATLSHTHQTEIMRLRSLASRTFEPVLLVAMNAMAGMATSPLPTMSNNVFFFFFSMRTALGAIHSKRAHIKVQRTYNHFSFIRRLCRKLPGGAHKHFTITFTILVFPLCSVVERRQSPCF